MGKIKISCETYTWQMPGESYKGKLDHIMDVMQKSGFSGIEPETSFFGDLEDPIKMKETLDKYNLDFVALVHVEDWKNPKETSQERANADKWMDYLAHFPDCIYLPVQMPGSDRKDLVERQNNLLACVNNLTERAHDRGIISSYHPNSPEGSVFRTEEDYKILLNGLNNKWVGYCPDIGHIAKAGMDPMAIVKEYRELVNLVHYKDMFSDGQWAQTGEGVIDFIEITQYLIDTNFEGWIVMEDECDDAITDPDGVTLKDGAYIESVLKPILK